MVDIRFLPIVQLSIALAAAPAVAAVARRLRPGAAAVALAALATLAWSDRHVSYIPQWIEWNYSGFERRPLWDAFSAVDRHLAGGVSDPRVVFEHSPAHNAAGSIRAFESLPLFSGRSTLEGLYVQSSVNSPSIFYLQSELSEVASCPFPDYHCARLDLARAAEHLRRYNAGQVVARSATLKAALRDSPEFSLEAEFPPYEVHRVRGNSGRYVVPLELEPVLLTGGDWKRDFYRWLKRPDADGVVLAWSGDGEDRPRGDFRLAADRLPGRAPRVALPADGVVVEEEIECHRIRIRTSRPGHPLLVRVSYHPRWRSLGGERIHLASPGFMLLFPAGREVTLEFGDPPLVRSGHLLTALGCAVAATGALRGVRRRGRRGGAADGLTRPGADLAGGPRARVDHRPDAGRVDRHRARRAALPPRALRAGSRALSRRALRRRAASLARAVESLPLSSAALHASFYRGLCAYRRERWQETVALFTEMVAHYPESPYRAEAEYHIALGRRNLGDREGAESALRGVVAGFPDTEWAGYAAERLTELAVARAGEPSARPGSDERRPS